MPTATFGLRRVPHCDRYQRDADQIGMAVPATIEMMVMNKRFIVKNNDNALHAMKLLQMAWLLAVPALATHAAELTHSGVGSISRQVQSVASPYSASAVLTVKQSDGVNPLPGAFVLVKSIQILGNKLYDTALLHALVADVEGKNCTLSQLNEAASRIADYYRDHGYAQSRVVAPTQTVRAGVVRVVVIEARDNTIDSLQHSAQMLGFIDSGRIAVDKQAWVTGANATDVGARLNPMGSNQWHANTFVSAPIGPMPAPPTTSSSSRAWVEFNRNF